LDSGSPTERTSYSCRSAALVTGASSGLGLAIAEVLGETGHGLIVAARRPEELADAVEQLRSSEGIKSVALCPGFVDTPMTEFIREQVKTEDMIKTDDIAVAVRFLLSVSPSCVVLEIVFQRPGEAI
jgi:NAD(P)-dependent dehydrogenase (short-subunit alcohol dehydrogenase family)